MHAKKSLGQHFLKSERALGKIIEAAELRASDTVLEIGPGTGALTEKLLGASARVVAVEKDDDLYEFLKKKFEKEIIEKKLILIHGDILSFRPEECGLSASTYKLVANIPYNITGEILRKFMGGESQPEKMVLLVQKEVAERIVGLPRGGRGSKESILSVSVKAYGKPRYVETVRAGSFAPRPRVHSAIIAVENISKNFFRECSEEVFFRVLKTGFKSKRKKLSSNLSGLFGKEGVETIFKEFGIDHNIRAEDLPLDLWLKLSEKLENNKHS